MKLSVKAFVPMFIVGVCASFAGCKDNAPAPVQTTSGTTAADNTKMNQRDRAPTVTPVDQGNNAADLSTTQQIRKALMADNTLSSDAKNAKVITANGVITLRGPVKTDAERKTVESTALQFAGANRVDNGLDAETTK